MVRASGGVRRLFLSVLAGSLLLQLAWIFAVPAFRGIDEFDHVIKADATARGQWTGSEPPPRGRGELMRVRDDVATALGPMCAFYDYTGPDNCSAVRTMGDSTVEIASAASAYNPAYYVVAGVVASPFPGASADFAMRCVTAWLSALMLAWGAAVTRSWANGGWPGLALMVSATPVLVYSTTIAAPNGVGMAGGILMWTGLLGVASNPRAPHLLAASTGAVAVAVTHTTGLLWVPLVLVSILLLRPRRWWVAAWRADRSNATVAASIVLVALAYAACWVRIANTNALAPPADDVPPLRPGDLPIQVVSWLLQTIAAFPTRVEFAPVAVYPIWVLAFLALLVLGCAAATTRTRLVLLLLVGLWFAVPLTLTVVSYASEPFAWQGRYAMPLAVGISVVAGFALSEAGRLPSWRTSFTLVTLALVAHVLSVAAVTLREADRGLSPTFADVVPGPPAVTAVLVGAIAALGFVVAVRGWSAADASAQEPEPDRVAVP